MKYILPFLAKLVWNTAVTLGWYFSTRFIVGLILYILQVLWEFSFTVGDKSPVDSFWKPYRAYRPRISQEDYIYYRGFGVSYAVKTNRGYQGYTTPFQPVPYYHSYLSYIWGLPPKTYI